MATEPVRFLTKSLLGSRFVNTFDAKNRLSKVAIANANTAQATAATSANTVTYRINALGQRVQKIGAGTFAQPSTIPFAVTLSNPPTQAQLQALNTQVTAFYANTRFIYDEQGRLLGEYSKDGKLVEETVWFDDLPVAVLKPKGASATSPVSGTGNVATNNQDANNTGTNGNTAPPAAPTAKVNVEVFYVHPDHLGTPRVITASTALAATTGTGITSPQTVNKAVWRWDSDPFGSNATANSAPNENPNTLSQVVGTATLPYLFGFDLAFPGQKRDRETGKHYNYFRDYDPAVGRYVESDPVGLKGGLSTFGYVKASPLTKTDERGLYPADSDPKCFYTGECKCATAECAAGLRPAPPPKNCSAACAAECFAAKFGGGMLATHLVGKTPVDLSSWLSLIVHSCALASGSWLGQGFALMSAAIICESKCCVPLGQTPPPYFNPFK
jgi:RHS repeat-associated protein